MKKDLKSAIQLYISVHCMDSGFILTHTTRWWQPGQSTIACIVPCGIFAEEFWVSKMALCIKYVNCCPIIKLREAIKVMVQFSSVQLLSRVRLFATPWIAARQASLSITKSWSLLRLMLIESVRPSSHLILCCPLLLLPPIPPSIMVFSNESTLCMTWPKYWSFSF